LIIYFCKCLQQNVKQQYLLKKVEELETKVKTHEKWLPSILDHNARKIPHTHTPTGKIRRTCAEIRSMDLTIPSGMQWIDPDGQGVGETPIYVYCDMTTGKMNLCFLFFANLDIKINSLIFT
jgi:hypothetical protein